MRFDALAPRSLALSSLVAAAALALLSGCSGAGVDSDPPVADGSDGDSLAGAFGCDYSFARPSPSHLYGEGYRFAVRYFSYDSGKNLTSSEAHALEAAGLDVVSNWEAGSDDALDGYSRGAQHAHDADAQAAAAGAPADRPIYFSVDFDASPGQQGAINDYMDGVASVIGRSRTGAYGGYYVIQRLFDAGKITWGWQAYAWSGGQWDPRAQARQIQNGLEGDSIDEDQAMVADIGQWSGSGGGDNTPPPPVASDCSVHSDGKLYCSDTSGSAMYASATTSSAVVNHLRTSDSWFTCWGTGQLHAGGNTTWYYTEGDDNSSYGWVPAVDLDTTSAFDANPSAAGLAKCTSSSNDPPPPSSDDPSCDVHSDGKLYCGDTSGAAMYASDTTSSAVVNHLRTSDSWFTCWGTGQLHAGGNTTWYYTEGDDNSSYGWVPAVDLDTTSAFDSNPSARGLAECPASDAAPPLPSDCDVHSDDKLYCENSSGAAMYASPHLSSAVVNHLRTTTSWFTCWGTGDEHAGGNTTWYYTEGDDNSSWGWVPAVDLITASSFDANPSVYGLPRCP
ncbi:MAG TPA: glycoside hydrolase domain-containing protein [Byssovorax sp.]